MSTAIPTKHTPKKDKYQKSRGAARFLNLFCSSCGTHVVLYQKDGPGSLLRLYLDRIFEPSELSSLQHKASSKSDVPNFHCTSCKALIGTPMIYEPEDRLALRLIHGSFSKKNSDGTYPPATPTVQQKG